MGIVLSGQGTPYTGSQNSVSIVGIRKEERKGGREGRGLGGERGEGEGKRKGTERRVATPLQKVTAKVAAVPQ